MGPLLLTVKDVMRFTGRGIRHARALIDKIREFFSRPKNLPITVFDFCDYHFISVDRFYEVINGGQQKRH